MADLSIIGTIQAASEHNRTHIRPGIAAATLVAGQSLYVTSAGKYDLCDANAAGHEQFAGITLDAVGAGQGISVLFEGEVAGYDLSGLAYGALVYQSDTAGALADAASGTKTVVVGKVVPKSDSSLTKVLYIRAWMNNNW